MYRGWYRLCARDPGSGAMCTIYSGGIAKRVAKYLRAEFLMRAVHRRTICLLKLAANSQRDVEDHGLSRRGRKKKGAQGNSSGNGDARGNRRAL